MTVRSGGETMLVTAENRLDFLRKFIISRDDVFARQTADGRYVKVAKQLTDATLQRHLDHKITVGCYNSTLDNRVPFALIDVDSHEGKTTLPMEIVQHRACQAITTLNEYDIPHTFAESSPGCYHIHIFFDPLPKTEDAYDFIRWITRNAGLPDTEVFPKQREVREGEYGNLVRLPHSIHQKKRTIYHYINDQFEHMDEFEVKTIDISGFKAVTAYNPPPPVPDEPGDPPAVPIKTSRGGVPPCIQSALQQEMTGGGGHFCRIAAVCAYRDVGLNFAQLCQLFTGQADHDPIETAKQVKSVLRKPGGYSYSCYTLREKCARFTNCEKCAWGKRFITSPAKDKLRKGAGDETI